MENELKKVLAEGKACDYLTYIHNITIRCQKENAPEDADEEWYIDNYIWYRVQVLTVSKKITMKELCLSDYKKIKQLYKQIEEENYQKGKNIYVDFTDVKKERGIE